MNLDKAILVWRMRDAPASVRPADSDKGWLVCVRGDQWWMPWSDDFGDENVVLLNNTVVEPDEHCIIVWDYDEAPEPYAAIKNCGGDEDWVALVPSALMQAMAQDEIPWLESGTRFGVCGVDTKPLPDGSLLCVGCHA